MIGYVSGIIVTYNPDISLLNKSLEAACKQLACIYVIDNGSLNHFMINELCNNFENVIYEKLSENKGLAFAQNYAIKKIKNDENFKYIILFDQDSVIDNGFIKSLLKDERELSQKGVKVGAIGPCFYDPDNGKNYPATLYSGPFIKRVDIQKEPQEATYIIASGCLIRVDVLEIVGLMKDELFIDYIDVEWSLRAKTLGYKVFISPGARMAHTIGDTRKNVIGRTISVHSPFRRYFLVRNSIYMIRLPYIPLGYKIRESFFNVLRVFFALLYSDNRFKVLKSAYFGMVDGILKIYGPLKHKI
jgi:rhamnosyltransferase